MALVNIWHLRKVAEASSKACDICYKPTTSVLITPDNKDFFYVCPGHLKDRGFCTPVVDEAEAEAKRKKEAMEREIELIKQEYEDKMKKKKKKSKGRDEKAKDEDKSKEKAKDEEGKDDDDEKAKKEKDDKVIKALTNEEASSATNDIPRIYALQKVFYQKRLDRKRNAEIAKRNQERLRSPTLFPSVPTGNPG